jgi:cell wall-associated NlpC family hydrolase
LASELGSQLVKAARSCIGTPFHHGGRVKGVALDCVGLLVVAGRECGLQVEDQPFYPPQDDNFERLRPAIERHCCKVFDLDALQAGDVLLFRRTGGPRPVFNHVGVFTEKAFVHAWCTPSVMAVVETPLDKYWRSAVAGAYRWREA